MIKKRISAALALIRWDKPYGTLLLLAPALWSLVIASKGAPPVYLVGIFTIGAFLMRSAGCAINDFADHPFDGLVERTQNRPLPSGRITPIEALLIFLILSFSAFVLIWWLNPLTRILSVIALALAGLCLSGLRCPFGILRLADVERAAIRWAADAFAARSGQSGT